MRTVEHLEESCNGCCLCGDACLASAISFIEDGLTGFWYPKVNHDLCIECGLCESKCPQAHPIRRNNNVEPSSYVAWSVSDETRMACTSGGIAYEIAASVIRSEGCVVACSYSEDYRGAKHTVATTLDSLEAQRGSKYVQSNTEGIFRNVRECLARFPYVLFVGTPCQVAALYSFLGENPDNLVTVDFVCNSINSPFSQACYIDYLEELYGAEVVVARAKDKRKGWTTFGSSAAFANGKTYYAQGLDDMRVRAYHCGHLFIRESCRKCQYKTLPRNADITLGDSWGIGPDSRNPKMEKGTSLVLVNSEKGLRCFLNLGNSIQYYGVELSRLLEGNPSFLQSAVSSQNSAKAFQALRSGERFDIVVERYCNDCLARDSRCAAFYRVRKMLKGFG